MSTESDARVKSARAASEVEKFDAVRSAFFRRTIQDDALTADSIVRQHLELAAHRAPAGDLVDFLLADSDAHTGPALLVVTDDMPQLVDALTAVIESSGAPIARSASCALRSPHDRGSVGGSKARELSRRSTCRVMDAIRIRLGANRKGSCTHRRRGAAHRSAARSGDI